MKQSDEQARAKKKLDQKRIRAEVEYLRLRLPCAATVYFSNSKLAPVESLNDGYDCTIVDVNESEIALLSDVGRVAYSYSSIKKICPRGASL